MLWACSFLTISSYETFNAVFVIMVLFALLLMALFEPDKKPKELCLAGLKLALMLVAALVIYYLVVTVLQVCTNGLETTPACVYSTGAGRLLTY